MEQSGVPATPIGQYQSTLDKMTGAATGKISPVAGFVRKLGHPASDMMTIRPATPADAALLTTLSATTLRESFGPPHNPADLVEEYIQSAISEAIMADELTDSRAAFFLLETPDKIPVGYAKLRQNVPPRRIMHRNAVEIQRIYLLQSQVGQGQGRFLMDHCLDWARAQQFMAVWLGVWERNERALAFYEKMGFERFGYHYFQFGSERQRDYWLQKRLIP